MTDLARRSLLQIGGALLLRWPAVAAPLAVHWAYSLLATSRVAGELFIVTATAALPGRVLRSVTGARYLCGARSGRPVRPIGHRLVTRPSGRGEVRRVHRFGWARGTGDFVQDDGGRAGHDGQTLDGFDIDAWFDGGVASVRVGA